MIVRVDSRVRRGNEEVPKETKILHGLRGGRSREVVQAGGGRGGGGGGRRSAPARIPA